MSRVAITFAIAALFAARPAHGQGALYVSNLGNTSVGSVSIGSDSWCAELIETGNNSGGYILSSVQLPMAVASGNPNGFAVSIYSDLNGHPNSDLGNLTGSSNPLSAGLYTYTASGLTLAPSTEYFIIVQGATPVAQGAYNWSDTFGGATGVDQWLIQAGLYSGDAGLDWSGFGRNGDLQTAIYAIAVPEPSPWVLGLLGGGFAFYLHARQRSAPQVKA